MKYDTIIIGGGQAGLATAYHLQQEGLEYLLLNAGAEATGSWPKYYDSLTLFSPAEFSSLPGMPFPGDPKRYPVRDEVVGYLRDYVSKQELNIRNDTDVVDVRFEDDDFVVTDAQGEDYEARTVVAATGSFNTPYIPDLPGRDTYEGEVIHGMDYRVPFPFEGKRVVVVGAGNSAIQIAVELAEIAEVHLAVRDKIPYMPQTVLGKDLHFWLGITGMDNAYFFRNLHAGVLDTGTYRATIAAGKPKQRGMFQRFHRSGVEWSDGSVEDVDAVIFATGFRPNLECLRSLDVSEVGSKNGDSPLGISARTPGLFFVGYSGQRAISSATLRGVGRDAEFVVGHIRQHLRVPLR